MKPLVTAMISALLLLPLAACDAQSEKPPSPPPLPTMPMAKPAAPEPAAIEEKPAREQAEAAKPAGGKLSKREKARLAKQAKQEASKPAAAPASKPSAPAPAPAPTPPPAAKPAAPAPARGKVTIPRTAHVSIDVPPGLQADLDNDPRMQPWANQVVSVADKCQTQNASATGTIEVLITMHENARPDADIKKLPSALSPIVACATGALMRTKMPLFTGKEGTRYTVKINFTK